MNLKKSLMVYGIAHCLVMLTSTIITSLKQPIWAASYLFQEPWFNATIIDAYLGFLIFYLWVFYLEKTNCKRLFWFLAIMLLGNIVMGLYIFLRAYNSPSNISMKAFLTNKRESSL